MASEARSGWDGEANGGRIAALACGRSQGIALDGWRDHLLIATFRGTLVRAKGITVR